MRLKIAGPIRAALIPVNPTGPLSSIAAPKAAPAADVIAVRRRSAMNPTSISRQDVTTHASVLSASISAVRFCPQKVIMLRQPIPATNPPICPNHRPPIQHRNTAMRVPAIADGSRQISSFASPVIFSSPARIQ